MKHSWSLQYYSPREPASFTSWKPLKRALKQKKEKTKGMKEWLLEQETHSMHKPLKKRFERRRVIVSSIDHQWQMDLADLSHLVKSNNGYKYLLGCIDVLSKYAWVVPLKSKHAKSVLNALKSILKEGGRKPRKLQSDKGTEFTNATVQNYLKSKSIHFFTTENAETKAQIIERFWRTLKGKMFKYFTAKGTEKYIDVLHDLVHSYNHTKHSSIGMSPAEVNPSNQSRVKETLYSSGSEPSLSLPKLKIKDYVRISKNKGYFGKGYLPNWSREIFLVKSILPTQPVTYRLEDQNRDIIKGSFYEEELQKVKSLPESFKLEKIIRKRRKSGRMQYFVKWLDYPDSFNSWINASDIEK